MLLGVAAVQGADPVQHPRAAVSLGVGAALCLLVAALAWQRLRRPASGWLRWRDGGWSWQGGWAATPQAVDRVELACDLQRVVLLRLWGEAGAPRWLWLERSRDPQRWDDLRRAVWAARR